jgi:bacterioferritin
MGTSGATQLTSPTGREVPERDEIVELLTMAYWMEIETVMNYLAASANLNGVRAQVIADELRADVQAELGHAQRFAQRLRELDAVVPGSAAFTASQESLNAAVDRSSLRDVIQGVLEAERAAIRHYRRLIEACEGVDYVTQDLAVTVLADEEAHRRAFEGYLREYESDRG